MHDDEPVGRLLSRREVLALLGATGTAWLAGSTLMPGVARADTPPCVVRPEQTEGPYFVDARLNRTDIRTDPTNGEVKSGVPLALTFMVSQFSNTECTPLPGAQVDVWHCDALGLYSGVRDRRFNTEGQQFLRGHQLTDTSGMAQFTTVYPGWYPGRAVHIHFMIRTDPTATRGYTFTSQLYFDDALTDNVHARAPYAENGQNRTRNQRDGIFRRGGDQLLLTTEETAEGYAASFAIGLQIP